MAKKTFKSAEIVETEEGRQYHIGCKPGDVAPNILLCGDPARAYRVASYFKNAKEPITSREFVTITGEYKGMPMTVMATGIPLGLTGTPGRTGRAGAAMGQDNEAVFGELLGMTPEEIRAYVDAGAIETGDG